jgi:hypothetical protein
MSPLSRILALASVVIAVGAGALWFSAQNQLTARHQSSVLEILSDRPLDGERADLPRLLEQKLLRFPSLPESRYRVILIESSWTEWFHKVDDLADAVIVRSYMSTAGQPQSLADQATQVTADLIRKRTRALLSSERHQELGWLIDGVAAWISRFESFSLESALQGVDQDSQRVVERADDGQLMIEALLQTRKQTVVDLLASPPTRDEAVEVLNEFVRKKTQPEVSYRSRKKDRRSNQSQPTK